MPQQLVTKSTYAVMKDRAPSAVSNWIADGKLTAPALVTMPNGDVMVDVDAADRQLEVTLHPSQQLAQAAPIGATVSTAPAGEELDGRDVDVHDADNRRFIKARADVKEAEAEGLRRRRLEETGKWLEREPAEAAFAKEMAASIAETEAWIGGAAETIAAELNVEPRIVAAIVRREWRAFRSRQAEAKRGGAAAPLLAAE